MTNRVLVIDDDAAVRDAIGQTLELNDLEPLVAGSFVEVKEKIAPDFDGIILSDIRMPGRDGFHVLEYAKKADADLPVILLTGEGDIPMAVRAMSNGAFDFIEKPCAPADLVAVIQRALKTRQLVLENRRLKAELEAGDPASRLIFGRSAQAEALRNAVRAAAKTKASILVTGAPGSGLSKVAEVIHLSSPRAKLNFEKRSSRGLTRSDIQKLWTDAGDGTVFLDEIGTLPADTQIALVDLIEQGGPTLIGGTDVPLGDADNDGPLTPDLYYRLQVCTLRIPSLAERPEDIPVLFRQYVAQASEQAGLTPPAITEDHIAVLMAREWPGNARAVMSEAMRFALGLVDAATQTEGMGLAERMAQVERSLLIETLTREKGQASRAAEALKLPRKTFYDKLSKYNLKPEDFRE